MDFPRYHLPSMAVPRTPSPPSSPPDMDARTPTRSGGSAHPWDRHHLYQQQHPVFSSPTPRPHFPALQAQRSSPAFSPTTLASAQTHEPGFTSATSTLSASHTTHNSQLFLKQEEGWQTLYPSEIAAFDSPTLREKLSQSNNLLTRLSSSLSEARTKAAHFTFQHRLLTIETNEAMQRHLVESEIAKREVEVLRKDGSYMSEQQRYELEEMLDIYKKRLRKAKALLRDAREEINEVRQENERLKKRIRENREHRIRAVEEDYGTCLPDELVNEDGGRVNNTRGVGDDSPSRYQETLHPPSPGYHPTPSHASIATFFTSPANSYPEQYPQTPQAKTRSPPSRNEEDALTTLGMLASQVLSQEGLSEPHTPHTTATQITTRATTPVRGITTVPNTPLSQSRNHPGPQKSASKTPRTPGGGKRGTATGSKASKPATVTVGSKRANAAVLMATPKYTSPTGPQSLTKSNIEPYDQDLQQPASSRGKKRKLSSDSTLSLNAPEGGDEVDSPHESEIEALVRQGSPVPAAKKKGKSLANGYVYGAPRGDKQARFNKRARGDSWGRSSPFRRG